MVGLQLIRYACALRSALAGRPPWPGRPPAAGGMPASEDATSRLVQPAHARLGRWLGLGHHQEQRVAAFGDLGPFRSDKLDGSGASVQESPEPGGGTAPGGLGRAASRFLVAREVQAGELRVVNQGLIPQSEELGVTLSLRFPCEFASAWRALISSRSAWTASFRSASLVSALILSFIVARVTSALVRFVIDQLAP